MTPRRLGWLAMAAVSLGWGMSFLLIRESLLVTGPYGVAWSRVAIGALVLGCIPASRTRLPRQAWPAIGALALTWMTVPMLLFPTAQQDVSSSTAGMINGSAPVFTAVVAALIARRMPGPVRSAGLTIGLVGVLAIGLPSARDSADDLTGVALIVTAVALYGVSFNITGRLQRDHGSLPIIWRSMTVSALLLSPVGLPDLADATVVPHGLVALIVLGAVSTGACFALFGWLAGTLDPTQASLVTYAVPVIALAVGVLVGNESAHPLAVVGVCLVLAAAYLVRRPDPRAAAGAG